MTQFLMAALFLTGTTAFAAPHRPYKPVHLKYSYTHKGQLLCEGELEIRSKDRYQLCTAMAGDDQIVVKAKVVHRKKSKDMLIQSSIHTIFPNQKLQHTSRPRIAALNGETSMISQSEETPNGPVEIFKLEVTPTLIN